MTKAEYSTYETKVADFLKKEGIYFLSFFKGETTGFSWSPCECCGSTLGGDRHEMGGVKASGGCCGFTYDVCSDCYYYSAMGRLDDETMLLVEAG